MSLEEKVIAFLRHCNPNLSETEAYESLQDYNFAAFLELISDAIEHFEAEP